MKKSIRHLILVLVILSPLLGLARSYGLYTLHDTLITKVEIEFASQKLIAKGWLFSPVNPDQSLLPLIVMAPDFGLVKECNYSYFAEQFAKAGFAVLLYDHLNFGASGSKVRQEVDPWLQVETYRDAISYAISRPDIDKNRIGLWGAGYSGGHVIVVNALDQRVKCFAAVTPFVSGKSAKALVPSTLLKKFEDQFPKEKQSRANKQRPMLLPLAGKAGAYCAIPSVHAYDFMHSFSTYAPTFQNAVTLRSLEMQFEYEPGMYLEKNPKTPKLFLVGSNDDITPGTQILEHYQKAREPKQLHSFEGHHYSPYLEQRKETAQVAITFFKKFLH